MIELLAPYWIMLSHGGAFILGMIVALLGRSIFIDDHKVTLKEAAEHAVRFYLEETRKDVKYCEHSGSEIKPWVQPVPTDFPAGLLAEIYNKTSEVSIKKALQKHQPRKHGRFAKKSS